MSQENVESVRRGYEHYNRTGEPDYNDFDPEVVYDVSLLDLRSHSSITATRGCVEFLALIREQWATMRLEPQDFI